MREIRCCGRSRLQVCNATAWSSFEGSSIQNRVCHLVTNCTAIDEFVSVPATATSDAVCIEIGGQTEDAPARDCRQLKDAGQGSGYYWIRVHNAARQTYCEMTAFGVSLNSNFGFLLQSIFLWCH